MPKESETPAERGAASRRLEGENTAEAGSRGGRCEQGTQGDKSFRSGGRRRPRDDRDAIEMRNGIFTQFTCYETISILSTNLLKLLA